MVSPLQTLTATMILVSLRLGCAEKVSGMRYIPNSSDTTEIKHTEFDLVNIVPQPSGLIPGLGWFLLPPQPKTPFRPYKDPLSAAPDTSYGIPNQFAPNPGYEASNPSSGEDKIPPVQCHNHNFSSTCQQISICQMQKGLQSWYDQIPSSGLHNKSTSHFIRDISL